MKRRDVLLTVAGITFSSFVNAQSRVPISDAHNHIGLLRKNKESVLKLGDLMTEAGVSLLSWTVVPDAPFLRMSSNGIEQGRSISAGDLKASFDRQLSNVTLALAGNGVSIVKTVADLDQAANGIPHVVLTSEGADFLGLYAV